MSEETNNASFNPIPEIGADVWVNSYCGPKCGKFQAIWPLKKKVLIEFHGEPEIVSLADCFLLARDCYFAAAVKKQASASEAIKQSGEYFAKAAELQAK